MDVAPVTPTATAPSSSFSGASDGRTSSGASILSPLLAICVILTTQHRTSQDQNLVNQQNEYYVSLRARANREGDAMARAFEESHAAYGRGDGAAAKEFSNQGKTHQREMERLNAEASAWIFRGEPDMLLPFTLYLLIP